MSAKQTLPNRWPDPCPQCGDPVTAEYHEPARGEEGPFTLNCVSCSYEQYVPASTTARTRIAALRKIVRTKTAARIDGYLVDLQTANACVAVYDALSPTAREKFGQVPLPKLVDFVWKNVR